MDHLLLVRKPPLVLCLWCYQDMTRHRCTPLHGAAPNPSGTRAGKWSSWIVFSFPPLEVTTPSQAAPSLLPTVGEGASSTGAEVKLYSLHGFEEGLPVVWEGHDELQLGTARLLHWKGAHEGDWAWWGGQWDRGVGRGEYPS